MAMKHKFQSSIADGVDNTLVQPSDWNDDHEVTGGIDLPGESVTSPPANNVKLFGKNCANKILASVCDATGYMASLQVNLFDKFIQHWCPAGNSTTVTTIGLSPNTAGTATAANVVATPLVGSMKRIEYLVTTASASGVVGFGSSGTSIKQYFRGTYGGFFIAMRFGMATGTANTSHRFYAGLTSSTGAFTDVAPSTRADLIGVGYDTADGSWKIYYRTGSGSLVEYLMEFAPGSYFPKPSVDRATMYELIIHAPKGSSSVFVLFKDLVSGGMFAAELVDNLPENDTLLRAIITASVGGVSSVVGIAISRFYAEMDY